MSPAAETSFSLSRIGQIAVPVHDVAAATAFYRDVLGMRFLFDAPGLAFFDCGGVRLMLTRPESPELDHPASILYYQVDDVPAAYEALRARGVVFEGEPHIVHKAEDHDLWMAAFRDPAANLLAIMAETPRT
jgi:methylmalonyl-CoA/ethylmalonyl-CoA epimerase